MRHILRDRLRSLLVLLLVCLAAMTAVLDKLNGLDCVRVPALTKVYAGCASSAKPVYAGFVEGSYYNWSRDEAIAPDGHDRHLPGGPGAGPVHVHLACPMTSPRPSSSGAFRRAWPRSRSPLVPGERYILCGTSYDAVKDVLASISSDSRMLLAVSASVGLVMLGVVLALYVLLSTPVRCVLATPEGCTEKSAALPDGSPAVVTGVTLTIDRKTDRFRIIGQCDGENALWRPFDALCDWSINLNGERLSFIIRDNAALEAFLASAAPRFTPNEDGAYPAFCRLIVQDEACRSVEQAGRSQRVDVLRDVSCAFAPGDPPRC